MPFPINRADVEKAQADNAAYVERCKRARAMLDRREFTSESAELAAVLVESLDRQLRDAEHRAAYAARSETVLREPIISNDEDAIMAIERFLAWTKGAVSMTLSPEARQKALELARELRGFAAPTEKP